MSAIDRIKQLKSEIIAKHAHSSDLAGTVQTVTVLGGLVALWMVALVGYRYSYWTLLGTVPLIALFLLRAFSLMHDCGHGSLFRNRTANRVVGFVFGVISGMPQYVWARHHNFHHATNGNWEKYRGAIATLSVREFAALTEEAQLRYARARNLALAPLGGFVYLLYNPRFTWIKGTFQLCRHVMRGKLANPNARFGELAASFETRFWDSPREYRHMLWNNLALLAGASALAAVAGIVPFLSIYIASTSLAGGAGLVLFTVQHNFEHAHATDTENWDYDVGAILGTSFLVLPAWLNWFTANIGYHHVHHLSASIPNYRLVACHEEYRELFVDVPRISLGGVPGAIRCILWDEDREQIISIAEYHRFSAAAA